MLHAVTDQIEALISGSDALILFQILPTYSVRKCTQILQTDLYTDIGA